MNNARGRSLFFVGLVAGAGIAGLVAWALALAGKAPASATAPGPGDAAADLAPGLKPYAALGSFMAENNRIPDLKWSETQFQAFLSGLRASYEGRGYPLDEDAKQLRDQINERVQAMLERERPDPIEDYFRTLREREGVSRTASNLHYRITLEGSGAKPKPGDTVVISYSARTPDGKPLPQLTRARVRVAVNDLLPGLAEGVQLLQAGGKALVYLPPELSFGSGDWPEGVPAGAPIAFFLELHDVISGEE